MDLRLPVSISVTGTIAEIKKLDGAEYEVLRRDTTAITVVDFNDQVHTIWVSNAQIQEYGLESKLFVGNIITVQLNQNVKDETYYEDADGDKIPHEETFESFVQMINTQAIQLHMRGVPQFIIDSVEKERTTMSKSTAAPATRFHPSRAHALNDEARTERINSLLAKRELAKSPVVITNINEMLAQLGYEEKPAEPEKAADASKKPGK